MTGARFGSIAQLRWKTVYCKALLHSILCSKFTTIFPAGGLASCIQHPTTTRNITSSSFSCAYNTYCFGVIIPNLLGACFVSVSSSLLVPVRLLASAFHKPSLQLSHGSTERAGQWICLRGTDAAEQGGEDDLEWRAALGGKPTSRRRAGALATTQTCGGRTACLN